MTNKEQFSYIEAKLPMKTCNVFNAFQKITSVYVTIVTDVYQRTSGDNMKDASTSKTYILCCPTLQRELATAMAKKGESKDNTEIIYLPAGLHNDPNELHRYVQQELDRLTDGTRFIVCPSGCGGGTIGLRATHGELIIPRTRDCLDILLSSESLATLNRPQGAIFMTADWMEFMKQSTIDHEKMLKRKDKEEAISYLRSIYQNFKDFYIIDTGTYDTKQVEDYIRPLVEILDGHIHYVEGHYDILRKVVRGQFDEDFLMVSKGGEVPSGFYVVDKNI